MELIDNTFPDLLAYLKRHVLSDKILTYDNRKESLLGKKVYICGGCELSYVYDYLSFITETYHTFVSKTSMDLFSEINNPNTEIESYGADFFIISHIQVFKSLLIRYQSKKYFSDPGLINKDFDEMFNNLELGLKHLRDFTDNPIWLTTMCYLSNDTLFGTNEYLINTETTSFKEMTRRFDMSIYETAKKFSDVYVLDVDSIVENYNKSDCIKPYQGYPFGHLTYLGSALLAENFYNQVCYLDKGVKRIKCAVFDLDNTLWDGILIEDGPDNLRVNQKFCNILLGLAHRGIILALCSKNEPSSESTIFDVLKKDSYGRHIVRYICEWRINWNPKSENLKGIAKDLNIGLDTLAFFDDSDFELREVNENAPKVSTYGDSDIYNILNDPRFNSIGGKISFNSEKRLQTYIANKERKLEYKKVENCSSEGSNDAFKNFMIKSEFKLNVDFAKSDDLERIHEVIQRTNQMNVTLERTDLSEIKGFYEQEGSYIFSINLEDKFGDYGNVGAVIVVTEPEGDECYIKEFALSCRAMGKSVEDATIIKILGVMEEKGLKRVKIKLVETDKNKTLVQIFKNYDFVKMGDLFVHQISDRTYKYPEWF